MTAGVILLKSVCCEDKLLWFHTPRADWSVDEGAAWRSHMCRSYEIFSMIDAGSYQAPSQWTAERHPELNLHS